MSSHTSGTSKYQNNELAPLVDGIMRSNSARLSDHEVYDDEDIVSYRANTSKTRRWIALVGLTGLLVGMSMIIHSTLEDRRRHHEQAQEIVIAETRPVNPSGMEPEELPVPYRPMCKYYYHPEHHEETSTTATGETESLTLPRIIQTSMGNPSKPWSNVPCVRATNPEHVELNQYGAPDAILQVHFDDNNDLDFPPILGFGGAFTEASALNFQRLQPVGREAVLELLFGKTGLGYALGRVPIHSCDFTVESYSFAEIPEDLELLHFDKTLQHDVDAGMIDMIRGAQKKNQESWNDTNTDQRSLLRLFASPWSPPNWMKKPTWEDTPGAAHASKMTYSAFPNCLREGVGPDSQYAAAWAMYFSKYISAYAKYGIDFWAVTVQNEPEFAAPWEACAYTAANMTDFVAYHLGPTLAKHHPNVTILAFDHNKDHVVKWMEIMLNASDVLEDDETDDDDVAAVDVDKDTSRQSELPMSGDMAVPYIGGVAYHWYAGGMDRLLDGAVGTPNLHRLRETLKALNKTEDFVVFNSEACHCPSTGYAGGGLDIFWDRAERYAHTILADLAAGSQGWLEWNLILDAIGGPNHVGNLCETTMLAVPHRATDPAAHTLSSLPDFEYHKPIGTNSIKGDNRTREELNALGIQAKFLDLGIAVQPLYYYMGHISRHVRPGSVAAPALVRQNLGEGEIFMPLGAAVVGGGENDLARNGIELTLWPCEGSTRQQFRWNHDSLKRISVWGHDWLGNQVVSCVGRDVDKDLLGMTLTDCNTKSAGVFDVIPIPNDEHGRFNVRLMNHPKKKSKHCLTILPLGNNGGANGPLGGPQVALGNCNEASAKWKLDLVLGRASTIFYADDKGDNELCLTTGWPFLQMGAFRTPTGSAPKTVVILNEAKDAANYALKDDDNVLITGSIPRGLFKQYF